MLNEKFPYGSLAGAWLIQAHRFAVRSSTRQTTHLNSDKKVNSKPSEMGRSPLTRLANRPIILRSSAYFEFYSFYLFRVFFAPFCFGRRFLRRLFCRPFCRVVCIGRGIYPKVHGCSPKCLVKYVIFHSSFVYADCARWKTSHWSYAMVTLWLLEITNRYIFVTPMFW